MITFNCNKVGSTQNSKVSLDLNWYMSYFVSMYSPIWWQLFQFLKSYWKNLLKSYIKWYQKCFIELCCRVYRKKISAQIVTFLFVSFSFEGPSMLFFPHKSFLTSHCLSFFFLTDEWTQIDFTSPFPLSLVCDVQTEIRLSLQLRFPLSLQTFSNLPLSSAFIGWYRERQKLRAINRVCCSKNKLGQLSFSPPPCN